MILRFATDLTVHSRTTPPKQPYGRSRSSSAPSGGCWRTLGGLADVATLRSYLDTATKWGIDTLHTLEQLFATDPWLPPDLAPAEQPPAKSRKRVGRVVREW